MRKGLLGSNPFTELSPGSDRNDSRLFFVDRETIQRVIDAAPDAEMRLIIALARFSGLRTPSETMPLEWSHLDWEQNRFTVTSKKTKRQGKAYRTVPIFPELRPFLEESWEQAEEGSTYLITRRRAGTNLRTEMLRIIRLAGVQPWPRVFQNLRASRETELADQFPLHVATDWIGNTPTMAARHYLTTTEQHFQEAAQGDARGGAVVVQKSVPQLADKNSNKSQDSPEAHENTGFMPVGGNCCEYVPEHPVPPIGLVPNRFLSTLTQDC